VIAWNPSAEQTFGRTREEAVGRPVVISRLHSGHHRAQEAERERGRLSDPVTIRDRQHRFVYANAAAIAQLGASAG
jgi:PAS domain S-box-containing protein